MMRFITWVLNFNNRSVQTLNILKEFEGQKVSVKHKFLFWEERLDLCFYRSAFRIIVKNVNVLRKLKVFLFFLCFFLLKLIQTD